MSRESLRPLVHAGALAGVALLPYVGRRGMAGIAAAAFLFNLLVLPRTAFGKALARPGEPRFNGVVSYPLAVAAVFALFPDWIAAAAWAVMAVGDPAAALVGTARPWRARVPWDRKKSLAGSAAFFLAAGAAALGTLWLLFPERMEAAVRGDPGFVLRGLAAAAAAGAFVETVPLGVDDNLPAALAAGSALSLVVAAGVPG